MLTAIQTTPAYELSVEITDTGHGHSLKFLSFVPTARRPEHQVKFQGLFTRVELEALRDSISQSLESSRGK